MFDKFGEFNSWEELNKAAEGQKEEGDKEALIELAAENGISKENAEDYFDGEINELCNPLEAAMGKLDIEEKDLKLNNIMSDWLSYIRSECLFDKDFCINVRKKDKSLKACIAKILRWSFGHQQEVSKDILKAAGVTAGKVTLGIPGMAAAHQIIREYYKEGR